MGELLSAVRYVKARRRGQHLTCWRFLSRKFTAWLGCRLVGTGRLPTTALTTWEYAALDRRLPEAERLEMLAILREQDPVAMDRSFLEITRKVVVEIAPSLAEDLAALRELAQEYLGFVEEELELE